MVTSRVNYNVKNWKFEVLRIVILKFNVKVDNSKIENLKIKKSKLILLFVTPPVSDRTLATLRVSGRTFALHSRIACDVLVCWIVIV